MKTQQFQVTIGGTKQTIVYVDPTISSVNYTRPITHHIFIIDRSGSMYGSIDRLVRQLHVALDIINPDDFVTIAWFSSPGQNGIIIEERQVDEDLHNKVNSLASTLGTTCFSEILGKINNVVSEKEKYNQSVIHLFTDGCPVVPWSIQEEIIRSTAYLKDLCSNNVVAVNTIGYGYYYNRDFLVEMSDTSEFGQMTHTSDIDQYYSLIKTAIDVSNDLVVESFSIECPNSNIIYISDEMANMVTGKLNLTRLDKTKNLVFVVLTDNSPNVITINGESINLKDIEKVSQKSLEDIIDDFMYGYAEQCYYKGYRQIALDIVINNLKDKAIADQMINAFSIDEVAEVQSSLRRAIKNRHNRWTYGKCSPGYIPKKDAFCLMDLLRLMINSPNNNYYIPLSKSGLVSKYARTGKEVTDNFNLFIADKDYQVKALIRELIWNKDRMNLSIRFKIPGIVKLNPNSAENVGLDPLYKSFIYRNHTIVKDGQLNINYAEFILSEDVIAKIEEVAPKMLIKDEDRIVLKLDTIPIINRTYIENESLDNLLSITRDIAYDEASQKAIGILLDELYSNGKSTLKKVAEFRKLTNDQIRVLEEHGIRKDGSYGGVDNTAKSAQESDSYQTKTIAFQLKGAASLPSTKEFYSMLGGEKKINLPGSYMIETYEKVKKDLSDKEYTSPTKEVVTKVTQIFEETNDRLQTNRQTLASMKLAKILTGDFFHGMEMSNDGNYTYSKDGLTMVVKTEYRTEYF